MKDDIFPRLETHEAAGTSIRINPSPHRTLLAMLLIKVRHEGAPTSEFFPTALYSAAVNQNSLGTPVSLSIVSPQKEGEERLIKEGNARLPKGNVDALVPGLHRGFPLRVADTGPDGRLNIAREGVSLIGY